MLIFCLISLLSIQTTFALLGSQIIRDLSNKLFDSHLEMINDTRIAQNGLVSARFSHLAYLQQPPLIYGPTDGLCDTYRLIANVTSVNGTRFVLYDGLNTTHAILAFRGTYSKDEIMLDFKLLRVKEDNGMIHLGFMQGLKSLWPNVTEAISRLPKKTIYITGHSLGAALATIATQNLIKYRNITALHTFASPRVGNDKFARNFDSLTANLTEVLRFVLTRKEVADDFDERDPGTILPPPILYTHVPYKKPGIQVVCKTMKCQWNMHSLVHYEKGLSAFYNTTASAAELPKCVRYT